MVNTLSICVFWLATFPPVLPIATLMICVNKNSSYAYEMYKWNFFSKNIKMYYTLQSQYFYHQIKRTSEFSSNICFRPTVPQFEACYHA